MGLLAIIRRVRTAPATASWGFVLLSGLSAMAVGQGRAAQKTPAAPPKAAWTVALQGGGPFRLAADASHVFVLANHPALAVRAAEDGHLLWSADPGSIAGVTTSDDLVFAVAGSRLVGLREADGQPRWTADLPAAGGAPAFRAGWLIVVAGRQVLAFRGTDGTRLWQMALPAAADGEPVIDGDRIFVTLASHTVAAVHITTGSLDWTRDLAGQPGKLRAAAGQVYFGGGGLFALGQDRGRVRWYVPLSPPVVGRPAADADRAYFAAYDNTVRAFNRTSGSLRWVCDLGSRPAGGPIRAGTDLLVPLTSGNVARCATRDGRLRGQLPVPEAAVGAPDLRYQLEAAVATADGGRLYRVLIVGDGQRMLIATDTSEPARTARGSPGPRP